jgi:hypothetical protein
MKTLFFFLVDSFLPLKLDVKLIPMYGKTVDRVDLVQNLSKSDERLKPSYWHLLLNEKAEHLATFPWKNRLEVIKVECLSHHTESAQTPVQEERTWMTKFFSFFLVQKCNWKTELAFPETGPVR